MRSVAVRVVVLTVVLAAPMLTTGGCQRVQWERREYVLRLKELPAVLDALTVKIRAGAFSMDEVRMLQEAKEQALVELEVMRNTAAAGDVCGFARARTAYDAWAAKLLEAAKRREGG